VIDKILGPITWEFVPNGSCTRDDYPTVVGPSAQPDEDERPQREVIKGFTYSGRPGDLLKAWLRLYPGNIDDDVRKIDAEMKRYDPKSRTLTKGELVVFEGLILAATLVPQRGRALFDPPSRPSRFTPHPGFEKYMTRTRFDNIKRCVLAACADPASAGEDPWCEIRPLINAFNKNRLENVEQSEILIPDELMSPYQPRTTPAGDLDHLSFVERKPKKLGTEFKCVADGKHGVMLFLEIQEGQASMAKKRFRDTCAPATAQALRLCLGVNGK